MSNLLGERIKVRREQQNLYLRQVAPQLEIDTAQLSKIEKGVRQLKRDQIPLLAIILEIGIGELQTLWLADQILAIVSDEELALDAMKIVELKLQTYE